MNEELNRTVLITGGEGALGTALAEAFAAERWTVLNPGRNELDVASEVSVHAYFEPLCRVDLLINNAGVIEDQTVTRLAEASWDRVVNTNLRGSFLCTRAAIKLMQPIRRGQVLFIGSRSARYGAVGQSNYAASKAGLIGFAQSLAKEYGQDNLRFNVVLPGFLETRMTAQMSETARSDALNQHALRRFTDVKEVARAIVSLASLQHVSGQVFQLDSRIDAWT